MVKNVCQIYLKDLKEVHFKLFLALALASGATRPHLGVLKHPPNPQLQGLKIDLCGYLRPNYFSRSAPGFSNCMPEDNFETLRNVTQRLTLNWK